MSSGILLIFLGAIQASLAVLLTISYGVIASKTNILKSSSSRDISKMCVRLFLPALLITNVGNELHADTAIRYVPILSMCNSGFLRSRQALPGIQLYYILFNGHLVNRIYLSLGINIHTFVISPWPRFQKSLQISILECARNMLQQYNSASSSACSVS
jgi:hypothetical protein